MATTATTDPMATATEPAGGLATAMAADLTAAGSHRCGHGGGRESGPASRQQAPKKLACTTCSHASIATP